ncbi:Small heat shock protein RTM2-like protein [Aduncisulcus paluster]|uniref:Small heat shock protein RTM2-like protein n=1 Tax=Aduncisulcus paluster TaxID=2918883 RepID=A0ABQ5K2Q7_9EUKA|nr:Small heat shock protein RTM2-like protein [Aduncisulcus paluster]
MQSNAKPSGSDELSSRLDRITSKLKGLGMGRTYSHSAAPNQDKSKITSFSSTFSTIPIHQPSINSEEEHKTSIPTPSSLSGSSPSYKPFSLESLLSNTNSNDNLHYDYSKPPPHQMSPRILSTKSAESSLSPSLMDDSAVRDSYRVNPFTSHIPQFRLSHLSHTEPPPDETQLSSYKSSKRHLQRPKYAPPPAPPTVQTLTAALVSKEDFSHADDPYLPARSVPSDSLHKYPSYLERTSSYGQFGIHTASEADSLHLQQRFHSQHASRLINQLTHLCGDERIPLNSDGIRLKPSNPDSEGQRTSSYGQFGIHTASEADSLHLQQRFHSQHASRLINQLTHLCGDERIPLNSDGIRLKPSNPDSEGRYDETAHPHAIDPKNRSELSHFGESVQDPHARLVVSSSVGVLGEDHDGFDIPLTSIQQSRGSRKDDTLRSASPPKPSLAYYQWKSHVTPVSELEDERLREAERLEVQNSNSQHQQVILPHPAPHKPSSIVIGGHRTAMSPPSSTTTRTDRTSSSYSATGGMRPVAAFQEQEDDQQPLSTSKTLKALQELMGELFHIITLYCPPPPPPSSSSSSSIQRVVNRHFDDTLSASSSVNSLIEPFVAAVCEGMFESISQEKDNAIRRLMLEFGEEEEEEKEGKEEEEEGKKTDSPSSSSLSSSYSHDPLDQNMTLEGILIEGNTNSACVLTSGDIDIQMTGNINESIGNREQEKEEEKDEKLEESKEIGKEQEEEEEEEEELLMNEDDENGEEKRENEPTTVVTWASSQPSSQPSNTSEVGHHHESESQILHGSSSHSPSPSSEQGKDEKHHADLIIEDSLKDLHVFESNILDEEEEEGREEGRKSNLELLDASVSSEKRIVDIGATHSDMISNPQLSTLMEKEEQIRQKGEEKEGEEEEEEEEEEEGTTKNKDVVESHDIKDSKAIVFTDEESSEDIIQKPSLIPENIVHKQRKKRRGLFACCSKNK